MASQPSFHVQREVYQSRLDLPEETEVSRYRAVSGLAVLGLLAGLLALGVVLSVLFWGFAIAGVVLNAAALRRIAANAPALLGRKAAQAGLVFSVAALVAVPTEWLVHRRLVRQEACRAGALWFEMLRTHQPHMAHQLTILPTSRDRLDDQLWDSYRNSNEGWMTISGFVRRPVIRTLLALGDKATVRYYDTESQWTDGEADHVYQTYAVSFADSEGLKSFFVGLLLVRTVYGPTSRAYWHVAQYEGGVRPKALGGPGVPPGSY